MLPRPVRAVAASALGGESAHWHRSDEDSRAISMPSTLVTSGVSRSVADTSPRRSGGIAARTAQIPKLTVRVRFPSPAPMMKAA